MSTIAVGRMKIDSGLSKARYHAAARAHTTASAEQVWALLADVSTWSQWGPWDETSLVEEGQREPEGVGAVRRIRRGRAISMEEVTAFQPGYRLAYKLRSGLPLRDYRAEVLLRSVNDGTEITWHSGYEGAPRGFGRLSQFILARFLRMVLKQLAKGAEQRG